MKSRVVEVTLMPGGVHVLCMNICLELNGVCSVFFSCALSTQGEIRYDCVESSKQKPGSSSHGPTVPFGEDSTQGERCPTHRPCHTTLGRISVENVHVWLFWLLQLSRHAVLGVLNMWVRANEGVNGWPKWKIYAWYFKHHFQNTIKTSPEAHTNLCMHLTSVPNAIFSFCLTLPM